SSDVEADSMGVPDDITVVGAPAALDETAVVAVALSDTDPSPSSEATDAAAPASEDATDGEPDEGAEDAEPGVERGVERVATLEAEPRDDEVLDEDELAPSGRRRFLRGLLWLFGLAVLVGGGFGIWLAVRTVTAPVPNLVGMPLDEA